MTVLTIPEVAERVKVSRRTVERAIERGELRAAVLGASKSRRVKLEWVDAWLEGRAPMPEGRRYEEPRLDARGRRRGSLTVVRDAA